MTISIAAASLQDRPVLESLMQLYLYDFSEITQEDVNESGNFPYYDYLPLYWSEPGRYPFLIRSDGKLAGLALVNQHSLVDPDFQGHSIAEFFVLRKYRRCGVGSYAATRLFYRFPGEWQVAELADNTTAQIFWRKVIGSHTREHYREILLKDERWHGPIQIFDNSRLVPNRDE
jgi:predicted acetyltransferase